MSNLKKSSKLISPTSKTSTKKKVVSSAPKKIRTKKVPSVVSTPTPSIDSGKRLFLKFAGIAGLGFLASSLFPKEAKAYVTGSTPTSNVVGSKDASNVRINPAKEDGNLATIKTNTDPLLVSNAGGYVRQDSTGTIAKETGGNLATIATNIPAKGQALMTASTPVVIASDQTAIPITGSFEIDAVGIKDTLNNRITPVQDDTIILLRRMVKIMESQATVDSANRQRITLDSLGTGTAITTTVPISGSLTTAGTVSTVSTVTSVTNMVTLAGQNQQMFQDVARNAYANGIRNNLNFS